LCLALLHPDDACVVVVSPSRFDRLQHRFARQRRQTSPDRAKSRARVRLISRARCLPDHLSARYTNGQAAVLGVVGDEMAARAAKGTGAATDALAKWIALATTLVTFALSLVVTLQFDAKNPGFQFVEDFAWFAGLHYRMGVDGISVLFVLLTAFLLPICIVASWKSVEKRVVEYLIAFLVLETLVIGVFCALDLVLFYLFFEGGLVPMFLIIGIWGGKRRIYAAYKFFLYTLLGSVLMLAAILAMIAIAHTSSIPR